MKGIGETKNSGCDHGFDGPFLFCDYWASVLGLKQIVNPSVLSGTGLSLEIFRKTLNRPEAALPKIGYFLLSILLKPFQMIMMGILSVFGYRRASKSKPYRWDRMRQTLMKHALKISPQPGGIADIYYDDDKVASSILNPLKISACCAMFFARNKVFLAALISLGYGSLIHPMSDLLGVGESLANYLGVLSYPMVLFILWLMFDDLLTACIAPLPLVMIKQILKAGHGFQGFVIAVVGTAGVLYFVEWFFIPRSLPPAVYLYVNDPKSKFFPYRKGHEPYWLPGKYYWVWRFVKLAPAELTKFWEKDWERLEIWIRADGEDRGRIEWIVTDWHYRELWFTFEKIAPMSRGRYFKLLRKELETDSKLTWVIELDMDVLFHSPLVRDIYLVRGRNASLGRRAKSILSSLFRRRVSEDINEHRKRLESLELGGSTFLYDVPELLRGTATRHLLRLPWTYWRFPKGAKSRRIFLLYDLMDGRPAEPELASDPNYQIKAEPEAESPQAQLS